MSDKINEHRKTFWIEINKLVSKDNDDENDKL